MRAIYRATACRWRLTMLFTATVASITAVLVGAVPAEASQSCELRYYWNNDGSPSWQEENVAFVYNCGLGGAAMTRSASSTEVATVGGGSVGYYWNSDGSSTWSFKSLSGFTSFVGAPAIARSATSTEIAAWNGGQSGDNSLWFFSNDDGSPTWNYENALGPGSTFSEPAMTRSSGATEIAVLGPPSPF